MFVASENSRSRTFHTPDCAYAKRIKEENRRTFATTKEARSKGFRFCPFCCRIGRQYRKDRTEIDGFCRQHGFTHFMDDGEMYIISGNDTAWRLRTTGSYDKGMLLLHESKTGAPYDRKVTAYADREYHAQRIPVTSIMGYLVYIRDHDELDRERTEKHKAQLAFQIEEVRNIRAVQRNISRQNRKKKGHREGTAQKRRRSNQQLRALAAAFTDYRSAKAAGM